MADFRGGSDHHRDSRSRASRASGSRSMPPSGSFGRVGHQLGEFYNLHFLDVDSKGNVYTAEVQGKRLQKFRNLGGL